jgi:hypothetical protein
MEKRPSVEKNVRNEQEVNRIINDAILEAVSVLGEEMSERDKEMLESVAQEKSPAPVARVTYLLQIQQAMGVSGELKNYINHILMTLRQQLTPEEQDKFKGWGAKQNLLNEIP